MKFTFSGEYSVDNIEQIAVDLHKFLREQDIDGLADVVICFDALRGEHEYDFATPQKQVASFTIDWTLCMNEPGKWTTEAIIPESNVSLQPAIDLPGFLDYLRPLP